MKILIYPGSFDPVTMGHLNLIERASKLCDKLIVAVLTNINKKNFFSLEERVMFLSKILKDFNNVEVESFSGLLVDFMKKKNASIVIKGLRTASDFEYEIQMAMINKALYPDFETLFMTTESQYSFISSSFVREIAINGGEISGLVPDEIKGEIIEKLLLKWNN